MSNAIDEIKSHYAHVAESFATFDKPAFRACFHLPCQVTTPDGVFAVPDEAAFEQIFGAMMDDMRARGLTRSVPERMHIRPLGASTALASIAWVRYRGEAVLERLGATYTLVRRDGSWLVAALIVHGFDEVIALDA